ncbi:serine/threonine-protein kinase [Cellulomonas fengjieae]|uniref:non-specific serine/threonine protein kinase n=1 Tax=Cellulomonas fengjieae TaxID=2819978 RepID=A0ABS3SDC8_9CELL|nr:serine/threonine-protein kinase [Cellulomonas fengjieae]MBO3083758.1 serine/threonine protein kinase [Cellulomonas fengjieae]QVI64946.1 serine/threonine protein kinase [Cellulomonas fengjieae]
MLEHAGAPRPDTAASQEPRVLGERYRLEAVLGRGGMATVHRAHDLLLGRDVAVKVFPAVHDGADDLARNRAEISVLATLSHPALVTLHDAGTVHGADGSQQVYLVMELVEGSTLAERLRGGALGAEQAALVGRDVAEALAVVHARGIIHRDIKPANILLTRADALDGGRGARPVVKLADFGIARLAGAARLTMTGMTLGTMSYLSPEQATGGPLAPASDVYGLGLVLLECATGRPAFSGTMAEVTSARLVSSPAIPDDLDPRLGDLLSRMTRLAPEDRPSAGDVAQDLAAILDAPSGATLALPTVPLAVGPAVGPEPASATRWRRVRSARVGLVTGAAVLLAVGALLVGQVAAGGGAPPEPPSYPAVEGTLGESLIQLQESVAP